MSFKQALDKLEIFLLKSVWATVPVNSGKVQTSTDWSKMMSPF